MNRADRFVKDLVTSSGPPGQVEMLTAVAKAVEVVAAMSEEEIVAKGLGTVWWDRCKRLNDAFNSELAED